MAFQFSDAVRSAMVNAIPTLVGASPTLEIYSGTMPANADTSATGTVLASIILPSTWMAAAFEGSAVLSGTWQTLSAANSGDAAYFRINQGATPCIQGTVTASGGGGDMTLDNITIGAGQQVTVASFSLTAGGA